MAFSLVETGRRADVSFSFIWLSQKAQSHQKKQVTFPKPTHWTQKLKLNIHHLGLALEVMILHLWTHTHTQSTPIYQALVFPDRKSATLISLGIHPCLKGTVSRKGIVSELSSPANANASMNIRFDIYLYFSPPPLKVITDTLYQGPGYSRSHPRHCSQHQCKYPTEFYHVIWCCTRKYIWRVPPHRWLLESISKACCRTVSLR